MAQNGSRVLIIGSDLRRLGVAKALGLRDDDGLSEILASVREFDEKLLQRVDGLDTLYLLPAGPCPPNPAELLCSYQYTAIIVTKNAREFPEIDHGGTEITGEFSFLA